MTQQLRPGIEQPNAPRWFQVGYYPAGTKIAQDAELLEFISDQGFTETACVGDASFILDQTSLSVVNDNAKFCMFFQFAPYKFDDLVRDINSTLSNILVPNGILYLSVNKYVAIPNSYDQTLSDDYDQAIYEYITKNVNGEILKYQPCGYDGGDQFNWIHPLTRFYIKATQ